MQGRQVEELQAYQRMEAFISRNAAHLGTIPNTLPRRNIVAAIKAITEAFTAQARTERMRQSLTTKKHDLREALRREMGPLIALPQATSMAPELENMRNLRFPPIRIDDMTLIGDARALRKMAARHEAVFIRCGRKRNFLEHLDGMIAALEECIMARDGERVEHRRQTILVVTELKRARFNRDILTATMKEQLREPRPDLLKAWMAAIRMRQKPGPKRKRASS
ncbi:MAG: hypothetical protein O2973_01475 [Gemmatimonadetes bacterium]|nr:hypothetical protein [Gemmatimonadota bacterium]